MNPKLFVTLSILFMVVSLGGVAIYSFFNTSAITQPVAKPTTASSSTTSSKIASSTASQPTIAQSGSVTTSSSSSSDTSTLRKQNIATHNDSSDCWIILNNKVLDVTNYLYQHPGGASAIIPYCGSDATSAFNAVRKHQGFAKTLINNFVIGDLVQ
jgi:cytochrome b involved in lipid metabolism